MMTKISFEKNSFKAFFIFLLAVAVVSAGVAIGMYFYFGHAMPGQDLTEGLSDKLSYGGSFSLDDILEEEQYNYGWIKSNDVKVEVYAINDKDESILTQELLTYSENDRTFKVVGVSRGTIKFISAVDSTVNFSVPFTTKFKSSDTVAILKENYPSIGEDQIFTSAELQDVNLIYVENRSSVDFNDIKLLEGLKKLIIKNTAGNKALSAKNLVLPSSATIYVEAYQYLNYINSNEQAWQNYASRIYPIVRDITSHSVVLYKNGGVFDNDNGNSIANLEVVDGESVSLSTEYSITRPGYQFVGWYSSNGDVVTPSELVSDSYKFKSDVKLYAKWQANSYTVKLYHNDGTEKYTEKAFTYDAEAGICDDTLEYSGFVQIGWASTADSTSATYTNKEIVKNLTTTNNGVVELYAIWVYQTFNLQYYAWNTQKEYIKYESPRRHSYGDNITIDLEVESGFGSFLGWAYTPDASKAEILYDDVLSFESIKGRITSKTDGVLRLYPVFMLESYDLAYDANGGDASTLEEKTGVPRGEQVYLEKQIEREGYKFKGWVDGAGYIWTSEALYEKDKKYYDTVYYPNKVVILEENEHGYSAPTGMKHIPNNAKVVLTADWVANTFKVVFTGDTVDSTYYKSADVPFGNAYDFDGETKKIGHERTSCISDYGSVSLEGGTLSAEQITTIYRALRGTTSDNDFDCSKTVTFSVTWTPKTYTINFYYDGGKGSTIPIKVVYGTTYGNLPSATRDNSDYCERECCYTYYGFNGWKYNGKTITSSTVMNVAGNHTLIASWVSGRHTESHPASCVVAGTLITMADGTKKPVEELKFGEMVTTFNHFTGKIDASQVAFIFSEEVVDHPILKLSFSDGKELSIVNMHGLFDANLNKYVMIDYVNVVDYLNHDFVYMDGDIAKTTKLVGYDISKQTIMRYTLISAQHINNLLNDFLCVSDEIEGLYNVFELDENMKVDEEKYNQDIATYGLSSYEEWQDYITYEEYIAFNGKYMNVAFGKGLTTKRNILELIKKYIHPDIIIED